MAGKKGIILFFAWIFSTLFLRANAQRNFISATASVNSTQAFLAADNNVKTGWTLNKNDLSDNQYLQLALSKPGNIDALQFSVKGISSQALQKLLDIYVTYDPANPGEAVNYTVSNRNNNIVFSFKPKYGAHVKLTFKGGIANTSFTINEITTAYATDAVTTAGNGDLKNQTWMNASLPIAQRVKDLLAAMTPADKMELLREGWGIPGIPRLGIPFVNKVEAIHGFSYGSGATIFPQSIALAATWDKNLVEKVGETIGDETASAHTAQAWSPVLDVAQDPRWGRCEETYGEDPVLVSDIGGAWIEGMESKGIMVTPKHFAAHGAPLGGRDSHSIGLSERELREIHLVPFREAVEKYHADAIMVNYSTINGEPSAKSKWLLKDVLRDEWGFKGFVVSDCGAIGNLTSRKHYVAKDVVEAANEALAAGVATNCGDTYNNPEVIAAAKDGRINMDNLNFTCATLLSTMFRKGLFEHNPSKPLNWHITYPGWRSPEHKAMARKAEDEAIVLLKNDSNVLPLKKTLSSIAVIGPGADDLQPGDYTAALQPGQLISVLSGIKNAVSAGTKVLYQKGCEFWGTDSLNIDGAVNIAKQADVAVLVLGDCSTSEAVHGIKKTSGEANDYASLILSGEQEKLLEAICETGKPVVLILQSGRPYNLSYASKHCKAILVNWLPGEEGGPATADVLFGDYNPAGRLPMTFPQSAAQLPLYYNFKPSGRGYNYVDMSFYPLYSFGYGLSYTTFEYSDLQTSIEENGIVDVSAKVRNTGMLAGDEVAQLYITEMYSSVDTRVMQLKNFTRIHLQPGETKTVSFKLTPYDLSLLNVDMDRVVEPGTFKIMVGGRSPLFVADDKIKNSVGYRSSAEGVNDTIDYQKAFAADFMISKGGFENDSITGKKQLYVNVKNAGNITDADKISMYIDGKYVDEHHFEIKPGESKKVDFNFDYPNAKTVVFTTKHKNLIVNL
ncbi:beta-glucosidase [Arachidicoccus ginsenosidimutans]|uniref:glycoside hydrolase family 3 N-terminal domain-containing protein n=1 Tax=Arachidicoccus sp. BS20 TaxID=1850526 RepID=UPI0007F14440|nr:glycoside hydrolase family 3 N-terminal domain-containing protein [Arachidicoccus sp. BS20]ANI89978.1 beta-glucosidase [Arachidicoccus sp. BS20]